MIFKQFVLEAPFDSDKVPGYFGYLLLVKSSFLEVSNTFGNTQKTFCVEADSIFYGEIVTMRPP